MQALFHTLLLIHCPELEIFNSEERLCEWLGLDLKTNLKRRSQLAYWLRDGL